MGFAPLSIRPDPDEPGAAEIWVNVSVAGRDYEAILDTGAATSRLPLDAHTQTFPVVDGAVEAGRGALGPGRGDGKRVVVPHLEIAGIRAEDVVVTLEHDAGDHPTALLGLDVLRGHRLELRMSRSELGIDTEGGMDRARPLLASSRGHPHVDVDFGDVRALAIWDTGAGATIIDRAFATAHPELMAERGTSRGVDAHGNAQQLPTVELASCAIGGRPFSPSLAAVAEIAGIQHEGDPAFAMILGYPVIAQADWVIDLAGGQWGFS